MSELAVVQSSERSEENFEKLSKGKKKKKKKEVDVSQIAVIGSQEHICIWSVEKGVIYEFW